MTTKPCLSQDPTLPSRASTYKALIENLVRTASDDYADISASVQKAVRHGTRHVRLSYARGAALTDFSRRENGDNLLNAYRNLGFNTVTLIDEISIDSHGNSQYLTDDQIEAALAQARKYNMNVILFIRASQAMIGAQYIPALTGIEVADRFSRWMKYDDGEIVGVYFLADDIYRMNDLLAQAGRPVITATQQTGWRIAARSISTDVPVLGMLGDLSVLATQDQIAASFNPHAYDHVLVLVYPYNISNNDEYGSRVLAALQTIDPAVVRLNNATSTDPDGELRRYINALFVRLSVQYFGKLMINQRIIPVGEAFVYPGSPAGTYIRPVDISIAGDCIRENVLAITGDRDWVPITYCLWGDGGDTPTGIINREDWWEQVRLTNLDYRRSACIVSETGVLARYVLGVK